MYQIGDRIYHKRQNANGIVVGFRGLHHDRPNEYVDYIGVKFLWARMSPSYHNLIKPRMDAGEDVHLWTRDEELVLTPKPELSKNVTMFGRVGFKKRLRAVCEIDRQYHNRFRNTDILFGYGKLKDSTVDSIPDSVLVKNKHVGGSKYDHCLKFSDLAPEVCWRQGQVSNPSEWVIKPYYSYGGYGIESADNPSPYHKPRYLQRKVNKAREFRAHYFDWAHESVPLIQEKRIADTSQLCWNKQQGGSFHYVYQPHIGVDLIDPTLRERIAQMAGAACRAIGYNWGAVDLALDTDNHLWIFEVNSQPGVRERSLATYKQVIWELANVG